METTIQAQQLTSVREVKKVKTEVQAKSLSDFWEKSRTQSFWDCSYALGNYCNIWSFCWSYRNRAKYH